MEGFGPLLVDAPRTFFRAPRVAGLGALDAQVAFVGVPYDGGTPQPGVRTGQSAGPAAVRQASWEQSEAGTGWYDVETDRDHLAGVTMADVGDVAIQGSDTDGNHARITAVAEAIAASGALLVAVGGDHSISLPLGRGVEALGGIDLVNVDAHADFVDDDDGAGLSGACQIRRLTEFPFVRSTTELGLRNVDRAEVDGMREHGVRWATTLELLERPAVEVVDGLVPESDALYVSIDIDVLDPSIVPGTTLPEPGGLDYRRLRELLAAVARRGRVVGFDVVELNPPHDIGTNTARVVAWIITHFLTEIFARPR